MTDVFNINYSNIFGGEKATRPNRMLRAAQKQESLALPDNYREIPEEKMFYEGGGADIPTSVIAFGIDVLCDFEQQAQCLRSKIFRQKVC